MRRLLSLGFVFVAACGVAQGQGETVTLRWRFPEDQPVAYDFDQERVFEIQKDPSQEAGVQRRSRKTAFSLAGRPDEAAGQLGLDVRLLRVRERVIIGKQDRSLDTGTLEKPGNWEQARSLLQPIRVRMTPRGAPFAVTHFGERALADMPAAERAHYETVLTEGIVRSLVFSLLGSFPERSVQVGATWTSHTELEIPGHAPVRVELKNTLERFRGQGDDLVAVIRQVGETNDALRAIGVELWQQEGEIFFHLIQGQVLTTQFVSRLISNTDEAVVKVDTAHRLVREGEEPPGELRREDGGGR